jgi:bacterioferritin-associated ferredoxin
MSGYQVNRCICHQRTFETLKEMAEEQELESVEELQQQRLCGCGCGLCVPYLRLMFKTGKTAFDPGAARE